MTNEEIFRKRFARRLREKRLMNNWTQAKAAKVMGCTDSQIAHWELGYKMPTLWTACRLSKALGIDLRLLCGTTWPEAVALKGDETKE
jgi:transcriptional regulator with XRE-family HTH domain